MIDASAFDFEENIRQTQEVVKYAHDRDIKAIIRGLRAVTDYEMEYQLHEINHYLQPEVEMVYLMANKEEAFISSSAVKEIYSLHGDISPMVPVEVLEAMKKKLG
jgi:pantetheine-phosphate adenylyltransferase